MICVDCGKDEKIFREGSCLACYLKRHQFTSGPDGFTIPYCTHCHAFKYKNNWKNEPFETVLKRYIKQYFSISNQLQDITISISCEDIFDNETCPITIEGYIDGEKITEHHSLTIKIKKNVCELCSKQFGGYHEAIIQIRPGNKRLSDEKIYSIQSYVDDTIISMQEQGNRKLFLADYGREHGGLDFFLSDKQAAYAILKKVQDHFGGTITTSSKNVGMKDGKQLYRYTYLLRLFPFEISDVIKIEEQYFIVSNVHKNYIHLINLSTMVESTVDATDLEGVNVIGNKDLQKEMILISENQDEIQVMDKKSYHIRIVQNPRKMQIKDEFVSIIFIDEEHMFLNPLSNQKG